MRSGILNQQRVGRDSELRSRTSPIGYGRLSGRAGVSCSGVVLRGWAGRALLLVLFLALTAANAWAQTSETAGEIAGTVLDGWENRPLPGVTVTVRGTTLAVATDAQGRFLIRGVPPGDHTVRFAKPGFAGGVVPDVRVAIGQTARVDLGLQPEFYELDEYEVLGEIEEEQSVVLLQDRQDAGALLESVGSEQFSKIAVSDAADIVSKLPGITVTEGKNPVVRGLNERYVGVQLNGAEVPSADPYRKSVQLDLFPAKLIDQVVVKKSFTPDQPGNFTGGGVNVVTKSFPEKAFVSLDLGLEGNTRTTFNDEFLSYEGGGLDAFAMDDGTRALPDALAGDTLSLPTARTSSGRPTSPTYEQYIRENEYLASATREMGDTQFAPDTTTAPPNHSFALSFGDTRKVWDRSLGVFGGVTYKHNYLLLDGISRRYGAGGPGGGLENTKDFEDTVAGQEVNWAGVVNLAYALSDLHQLSFNFLHNQNAEDQVRVQEGFIPYDPGTPFYLNRLQWTERHLTTYQLKGNHELPSAAGLKVDWLGALSDTSQEEPDARFFNYRVYDGRPEVDHPSIPSPKYPTRYFRNLEEGNANLKLDFTLPVPWWNQQEAELKTGGFLSLSDRDFVDREIYYREGVDTTDVFNGNPNDYLTEQNLGYTSRTNANGSISYTWNRYIQSRDSTYSGTQDIFAGYLMAELPLWSRLRLIGGARYETTDLVVDSVSYQANSNTGSARNNSELDEARLLPAVTAIYTVTTNMNLRASYSQTLARPSFRELSGYRGYDPVLNELVDGNPLLEMSDIRNYDLRWEWFPRPSDLLAVSLFYKQVGNAIEKQYITLDADIVSWENRDEGQVYGIELEARSRLDFISPALEPFTLGGNLAFMQSEVDLTPEEISARTLYLGDSSSSRPLYDQSPYVINVDLGYDNPGWGSTASLSFGIYGPRIVIAGLTTPDVYEQPTPLLEFVWTQKLGDHWKLKFSARNLLDPKIERTYGEHNSDYIYSSFQRGRLFGLSLGYEF